MKRDSAPLRPDSDSLCLIDDVVQKIRPDDGELEDWVAGYVREHRLRLATDLDLVALHVAPGVRVLDAGAAPFVLTGALSGLGYDVCGVDLEPDRFARAIGALGLDIRRCDMETEALPFDDASVGAVLFNELFEHLRIDPIFTLGEVFRVMAPGGVLLLSTPNLRSFRGLRNLILSDRGHAVSGGIYEQYEKLRTLGHMGHVSEYTVTDTTAFLERIGFEVETIIYRGGHGAGIVGLAERMAPSFRPFFTAVARRPPIPGTMP